MVGYAACAWLLHRARRSPWHGFDWRTSAAARRPVLTSSLMGAVSGVVAGGLVVLLGGTPAAVIGSAAVAAGMMGIAFAREFNRPPEQ